MSRLQVRCAGYLFAAFVLCISAMTACSEPSETVRLLPTTTSLRTERSPSPTHVPTTTVPTAIVPTATAPTATAPTATLPAATVPPATHVPVPTPTRDIRTFEGFLGQLDADWVGEHVTLTGHVVDLASFSRGFKFTLEDRTGRIVLLTWEETYDDIAQREGLHIGALVQASGTVGLFDGELQIVPATGNDVTVIQAAELSASGQSTGSIAAGDLDKWATIEGQIVNVKPFSSGLRVTVDDGSGEVLVLLWQNVLERAPDAAQSLSTGARVRVSGSVVEYQGSLEIVPAVPFDIDFVARAAEPTAPSSGLTPITEIDAADLGKSVTISGQVANTASFSRGFKFTLDDGTGQITLVTWHNVYDAHPDAPHLNVGAVVEVGGWITEFEGELQIEPPDAEDVKVNSPPQPIPPVRGIAEMAAYIGQRIAIAGNVVSVEETRNGAKVFVSDETGKALVFIWSNILERIPDIQLLGQPGTSLRVVGVVQTYQGELELVPALPVDVEVVTP